MSVARAPLEQLRPLDASSGFDVADALRLAIVDGTLPPGARLRQSQLAEVFGTSRTPIREALHKLNAWGLVDLVVNHAAVVRRVPRGHYAGAFVVWAELDALAVELAIENARDIRERLWSSVADERRVADAITGSRRPPQQTDSLRRRWIDAHNAFHETIIEAAESPRLKETIEATTALLTRQTLWEAIGDRPYPLGATAAQHAQLARLIEARDKGHASASMREHIMGLGEAFLIWWDRVSSEAEDR
jgi:DNA-binding GntR family transcriptional regulator